MAKGLGATQAAVIDVLKEKRERVSLSTLIWAVATREPELLDERGNIPEERYGAIHLSIQRLLQRKTSPVRRLRGYITTFDELEGMYADRTCSARVRGLRRWLLPHVRAFVEQVGPKKSDVDTEDFVLSSSSFPDVKREAASQAWSASEPAILMALAEMGGSDRDRAIELVVRAREILGGSATISARVPLLGAIAEVAALGRPELEKPLAVLLRTLPAPLIRRASFKQRIYQAVSLHKQETPHLTDEFKAFLLEKDPATVSGLLGHEETKRGVLAPVGLDVEDLGGARAFRAESRMVFSKQLDQLIDAHLLRHFYVFELVNTSVAH